MTRNATDAQGQRQPRRHPGFGVMKGTFKIARGVDLTEPAPEWTEFVEEKHGNDRSATDRPPNSSSDQRR
jgi:hypothetical protein